MVRYYAIFRDGSYSPLHNLESISAFSEYAYILMTTDTLKPNGYVESTIYQFVNAKGELEMLRIANWELLYISPWTFNSEGLRYCLYNHLTKTAHEFRGEETSLSFFKNDLFPKLRELSIIPDYHQYLLSEKVDLLEEELTELRRRLYEVEKVLKR
ncbi:hypothetical protein [Chitinophaga pinensis]|uniref:Uncharacterized protein n=1 Tax=Chitinophaga pinensis (strain ATCC 43595 / DSM 2588 / LMG 13176 / NBRC 15968 / NCIMB 11800 / UQM 2034) TaxID=485918 RepID=A0A979G4U5_CHIPD|nr:hypothetical protein [Chitinophaga pinensis]ACU60761.1 hypothetical protein Cpin_3294 [Chitinophaga pinensis DSM 2588]